MKMEEIRALSSVDLKKELDETYREMFNLRVQMATKQLVNYRQIRHVRKKIARIKTVLRERELAEVYSAEA